MKTTSIKQPLSLFILCIALLSSVSLETFCMSKSSDMHQEQREKQNKKKLNIWTGISCAIVLLGVCTVASTFPPAPSSQLVPAVQPIPLSSTHSIHLDTSVMNPHLLEKGKKK